MADKKFNLDFYAKVQTDVSSVKEVVKNLKNQLETLKLPIGATKNFERTFTNLEKSIQDFESAASNGITNLADTKKIDAAWKKITGLFSTLGIQIKDLNSISDQVFPKEVSNNISKAAKALGEYQAKIEAIKKSQSYIEKSSVKADADSKAKTAANEWQKQQDIFDKKQRDYDAKQNAWNQNRAAQYQGQKDQISKITQEIDAQNAKLQEQIEIQKQLRDAGVTTKEGTVRESHKRAITSVEADIAGMEKAQKLAKENLELAKKTEAQAKKAQASAKGQETKILKKVDAKDPKAIAATQAKTAAMQAYGQAQSEAATKAQELADIEANLAKAKDRLTTLQGQSAQAEQVGKRVQDIEDEIEALDKTRDATKKAAAANAEYEAKLNESKQALEDQKVVIASYETAMNDAKNTANSLGAEMNQMELDQAKTEWEALIKIIKEFTGIDLTTTQGDIQEITRVLEEYKADQIKKAPETIEKLGEAARQAEPQLENMKKAGDEVTESIINMTRTERDIENLKDQILYFFSISNTVQIFKDAVRIAVETVKELDAVMTETAVVTDFSVGDMWDKLPEYSDEANKLGTSISGLYEATTLYYQQGLKSQEAMDVGIETMKMARIANMGAAAATEAMTAALRGFNMEINETNATRINDVYSELAAITAADTEQIATAMSKTASIADAANMEFETTAAFLAQIIETTQEAPETAGTAMKTIIARFTEVKELFDEGMLSGKDAEGEEININKIDAALKKVGISLNDFLKGEKGIDDIFLELASKWDTLDLATQRYIATTAAGSRQQSRFLAMMGNYDRTMELVTAANNSAGASQKQFDKTLESLEAKLQRLNNAWQEFTMGLANNEVIKAGVDLLTWLLETINKITGVAGNEGLGGVVTMFARLATVIGALKGGGAIIKNLISGMAKTGVFSKNTLGNMGLDETGNWIKDISLMRILMNTLNITTEKSHILFGKLGIAVTKAATGFKLAGAEGAVAGAAVTIGWLPVVGIIAGIIVIVWALVAAFKAAHAASPEGKLEAASAAADGAAEAAEGAAQAYEHLASALDSIGGKSATLENLAVGTTEWKNAVQELNGEILDLVEKYPELAKFVDSSDGHLKLDMEGTRETDGKLKTVKDILSDYQGNKFKAQSASAAAKIQKQQAQIDLNYSKLDDNIKIIPKIDIPEYNPLSYSTQVSQLQGGPYSVERAQKIATVQKEWSEAEKAYNEAKLKEANVQFSPETRELTEKVAKAIASNQIEGISIDEEAKNKTIIVDGESYTFDNNSYDKLEEYGEGLIAADAATKVFTDSLLSNALMVAEVSNEQKANMMNFMSSEQIDSLVKNKKEEIAKDGISDEEKIQYAETMGYEYINGKFYTGKGADQKEVAVSDDSIAAQLAGIQAQDDLTGRMKALDGVLGKIDETSEEIPGIFERMTEKGEGAALTLADFEKMKTALENTEEGSELDQTYKKYGLEDVYGSYENFINFITNSTKLAEAQHAVANKKLTTIGMADYTKGMNLDIGQTKNIADLLYESVVQSGQSEGKKLAENLKEGLEEEGEGKKLAEALGMINLDNIDSIKKLSEYLEELEYAGEIDIDDLEQQIIEATNASKKFSLDNLKEELKSVQDLIKDIKDREETDRIYSEEDYKKLIESGKLSASDFVMQGIDEYVYIGETNEQLISALQENTAALPGETQEKLREAAEKSQTWDKLKQGEDTEYQYDLLGEIATGKKTVGEVSPDLLIKAMGAVGLSTEEITPDMLDDTGGIIGNVAQIIKDRITSAWNTYGSANAITGNLNAWENFGQQSLPQMYYSQMSGQEILNAQGTYQAEGQDALGAEEDQAARIAALEAKLAQIEGGTTEADATFKDLWGDGDNKALAAFQNNAEAAIEYNKAVKAAVVDSTKLEQKMSSLADTIKDSTDALKEGKKGGDKYQKALDKVAAEAEAVFGENYTKEFVEENLPLFLDWADGVEGSTEKIRDAMLNSTEASFKNIGELRKNIAALDGTQLNIYGYANMSEANGQLYGTQQAAEEAAADINALGMYKATVVSLGTRMENGVEVPNGWDVVVSNAGGNVAGSRGGGGGGGGGGGSEWKNPYDKLYNTQENIDRTIREREQIERRYQRLLDRRLATAQELYETSQSEIDALREQAEYQQKMLTGRQEMLQEEMDKNKDLQKYATADIESGQITIDWDLINSVKDEEEGKKIEEYISKLEELRDSMHESQDAIEEINDSIWEIEERGREEYMDFEERIKEAITENRQREIDTLEEINNSINDTNSKLIDSIQKTIDKFRQDRENERTEEDLQEKQRRLAYLEQDTSGANALEILELREEIEQGQEDYTDSLIDQKISELQEQNDEAAEQREKQITLMQNQLDWYIESGRIWAEVDELLKEGLSPQGGLIRGSKLEEVMKNGENWSGLSKIGQMEWLTDLETLIAQSMNWQMMQGQLENLHDKLIGQTITIRNANGEMATGKVDEEGKVVLDDGSYYEDVYQWIDGRYYTTEQEAKAFKALETEPSSGTQEEAKKEQEQKWYRATTHDGKQFIYHTEQQAREAAADYLESIKAKIIQEQNLGKITPEQASELLNNNYYKIDSYTTAYKTGGLADFTGPAWLDGTKSRPELVLNQRDTQNFIQLKDILSSIMSRNFSNTQTSTENNGDITYDIDINVETIGSDYDVEQVANKVKSMINENARYRNNNAISLKR